MYNQPHVLLFIMLHNNAILDIRVDFRRVDVLVSSIDISGSQGQSQDVRVTLNTLVTFHSIHFDV